MCKRGSAWPSVLFVHTKTHCLAERCFQMPGGALGPGFRPRALPLPKNPEEYRRITKYTEENPEKSRRIPENTERSRNIPGNNRPAGQRFRNPGDDLKTYEYHWCWGYRQECQVRFCTSMSASYGRGRSTLSSTRSCRRCSRVRLLRCRQKLRTSMR